MPSWARMKRRVTRGPRVRLTLAILAPLGVIAAAVMLSSSDADPAPGPDLTRPGTTLATSGPERAEARTTPAGIAHHRAPRAPVAATGANLWGTIRWDDGSGVAGAEVALLDEAGAVVAEVMTDDAGAYALEDDALAGAELQVTEPLGTAHQRDLTPLYAGERRNFDVVLGGSREVVGWVLDGLGDPQPGVMVTLTWEAAGSRWTALTDGGGGFTFTDVPETPLRVTADGGELGIASVRVAQTSSARREVTLTLEPTGTITVSADPAVSRIGAVTIRCYSDAAHGEDGLWADDLRDVEVVEYNFEELEDLEVEAEEALVEADPSMQEVEAMIADALKGWDPSDPEGSLVQMAIRMAQMDPEVEREMRRDLEPDWGEMPLEEVARLAARKVIEEEPRVLEMLGQAALHLQEGHGVMDAFMMAEEATRDEIRDEPAMVELADEVDGQTPEEVLLELEEIEADDIDLSAMAELEDLDDLEEDEGLVDPIFETLEELRQETGIDNIELIAEEERSVVATGPFFTPIPVRGAFEYRVSVKHPDGLEIICGTVFVAPGEDVEVRCGGTDPAVLTGRVVDSRGHPVGGALVEAMADVHDIEVTSTTTNAEGYYELELPIREALLVSVFATDPEWGEDAGWPAERRQQNASPGTRTVVPDLVLRTGDESRELHRRGPFGGVGASIGLGSEGIVLQSLFEDGPLYLAGAGEGDVIVRIGEELGASLSVQDAVAILRGEAGTDVDLTLRSAAGEIYELLITRGIITP